MLFDPIERARIKKHIGIIFFALLLIVFARSIVDYITGGVLSTPPEGLEGLASAIDRLIKLSQFVGGAIATLMLIWSAIRLKTTD